MSRMNGTLGIVVAALCVAMAIYQLTASQTSIQPSVLVQNTHLGFALQIVFLGAIMGARGLPRRLWLAAMALVAFACSLYVQVRYDHLIMSQGFPEPFDILVGTALILVTLEATRQHWGPVLPAIAAIAVAYYIWGYMLPTRAAPSDIPYGTIVSNLAIGLYSGLYGQFMAISANFIFLFMVFGGLLQSLDGNRAFIEIGKVVSRRFPGGGGLGAVLSSSLMGSVTGAAVANVAITGSYTIPIMKREGYTPATAAAIEATASTGGQLVPPVMGSVAFVMAAVLSTSYLDVMAAALLPAILFFLAVLASVWFKSRRLGLERQDAEADIALLWRFLPLFAVPTAVLVWLLLNLYSVSFAGFWAIMTMIATRFVMALVWFAIARPARPLAAFGQEMKDLFVKLVTGLSEGARMGAAIAVVIGSIGLLAESITATGAAVPLGTAIEHLAFGSIWVTLLLTAVMCILLGAGVPTVGAYVLTSAIAGPILVQNGVDLFVANFFILYFAVLSAVTPPVAAAALAASAIAGCGYFRVAWEATVLSAMLYILPFFFITEVSLLLRPEAPAGRAVFAFAVAAFVSILVAAAAQGWWAGRAGPVSRLALCAAAIFAAAPLFGFGDAWLLAGIGLAGGTFVAQRTLQRQEVRSGRSAPPSP